MCSLTTTANSRLRSEKLVQLASAQRTAYRAHSAQHNVHSAQCTVRSTAAQVLTHIHKLGHVKYQL